MADEKNIPEHLARLLSSSIESVERLDVLLHLRRAPEQLFTARALAKTLQLPLPAVEQHLMMLCGRGFLSVSIGSDHRYGYKPVSPTIDVALAEVAELNARARHVVVAALAAPTGRESIHAFANAFLVRRSDKKGGGDA